MLYSWWSHQPCSSTRWPARTFFRCRARATTCSTCATLLALCVEYFSWPRLVWTTLINSCDSGYMKSTVCSAIVSQRNQTGKLHEGRCYRREGYCMHVFSDCFAEEPTVHELKIAFSLISYLWLFYYDALLLAQSLANYYQDPESSPLKFVYFTFVLWVASNRVTLRFSPTSPSLGYCIWGCMFNSSASSY